MRRNPLLLGAAVLIFGVLVVALPYIIGISGIKRESIIVLPLTKQTYVLHLRSGERLEVYFTVSGGANDIRFWIGYPATISKQLRFNYIFYPATISKQLSFDFTAPLDGDYWITFSNWLWPGSEKYVSMTIKITPIGTFSWITSLGYVLSAIGLIVIIIGGVIRTKEPAPRAVYGGIVYCIPYIITKARFISGVSKQNITKMVQSP